MRSHADTVQQQFDPRSQAYLNSTVHAAGPDLQHARALVAELDVTGDAIDIGCGAGHLAFLLTRRFARVVASDPSPAMLATVVTAARERGLAGLETCLASAEKLPH